MKRSIVRLSFISLLVTAYGICAATTAHAYIKKIQITTRQSPAFGGYSWPGVGQYEKIAGKAFGELDPKDPRNQVLVDLQLAPRNAGGKVEYSFDFYLLKPVDLSKGSHKMLYEPPNRGRKTIVALNRGVGGNDPGAVTDASLLGDSFLLPQGYSLSFSGWDASAGNSSANFNTTITLPVARNADGSPITGPAYEYIVNGGTSYELTYAAATIDRSKATLTHRVHLNDKPEIVPSSGWQYNADGTAIGLLPAGTSFVANDIYEFSYTAKDPTVNGVGFAAVRDDVRQRAVVAGVPNRRNETITQLAPGVAGRAVWHANWLSVIDVRLVVGIVGRIGPSGRTVCGGCHTYREQATNEHRREQRGNNPHFQSPKCSSRQQGGTCLTHKLPASAVNLAPARKSLARNRKSCTGVAATKGTSPWLSHQGGDVSLVTSPLACLGWASQLGPGLAPGPF